MILTAVLIPPALLLLIIAMDRLEDRILSAPEAPRHARPRGRLRLVPGRGPGNPPDAEDADDALPEVAA
ncbi:hypothetical protein [Streptomyces sp. NPDC007988]|uniref:hypothetical protein n=1 Tax=Streptomyces sp. NPDC007988 TaxID=3364802 RepID=UPI0036E225A0